MLIDIGVMIGSSADGMDIVGAHISDSAVDIAFHHHYKFTQTLQCQLKSLVDNLKTVNVDKIKEVESKLTQSVIDGLKAIDVIEWRDVRQVSFHGYTLCHYPQYGLSWQLGDPKIIAEGLNCIVIHDFRQTIIEHGGIGAPLVPNFHHWLTKNLKVSQRNYINLGGVCNISIINGTETWGSDIGPGNCLSDQITRFFFNRAYDEDGCLAQEGDLDQELFNIIDVFYADRLPCVKNFARAKEFALTREDFDLDKLVRKLARTQKSPCDILASTHHYVASRIASIVSGTGITEIEFFGGGVLNKALMDVLKLSLSSCFFHESSWHPQIMESLAFAWLGNQRMGNVKHHRRIIGTSKDLLLGSIVTPECNKSVVTDDKILKLKKIFY